MSPLWGNIVGGITVMFLLIFSGVWLWAWSPFHKNAFDELARLPMHDGGDLDRTGEDHQR